MVGLQALAAVWLAASLNAWRDEAYSLATTSLPLKAVLDRALFFEAQPPLYFLVLWAWRKIDPSLLMARLLSVGLVSAAIVLSAAAARRWLPRRAVVPFVLVVATHPLVMWCAVEVRAYPLVLFLSAALLAVYDRAYGEQGTARGRAAFVLLAIASLYTQHYLGFVLAGLVGATLVGTRRRLGVQLLDMGIVAVFCAPLWSKLPEQVGTQPAAGLGFESWGDLPRFLIRRFEGYAFTANQLIGAAGWGEQGVRLARWSLRAAIVAFVGWGAVARLRSRKTLVSRRLLRLGIVVAIIVGCVALATPWVGTANMAARHTVGALVPTLLITVAVAAAAWGRRGTLIFCGVLAACNVAATVEEFWPLAKECDCRRVAAYLEREEHVGEPILVFPAEDVLPLAVHYHGVNQLVAVPREPSLERWDVRSFVIQSEGQVGRLVGDGETPRGPLWVYTGTIDAAYGVDFRRDRLEAFLRSRYVEVKRREFHQGVTVRRFEPR